MTLDPNEEGISRRERAKRQLDAYEQGVQKPLPRRTEMIERMTDSLAVVRQLLSCPKCYSETLTRAYPGQAHLMHVKKCLDCDYVFTEYLLIRIEDVTDREGRI